MVEVDVQFLAGVAVTVFLALIFFGVVVLWDVALALRSVGDKIDKLEDNIDDDLKDIGHSLDGISRSSGTGGGTQLHLNGGTISSGGTSPQPERDRPPRAHADHDGYPAGGPESSQQPPQHGPQRPAANAGVTEDDPQAGRVQSPRAPEDSATTGPTGPHAESSRDPEIHDADTATAGEAQTVSGPESDRNQDGDRDLEAGTEEDAETGAESATTEDEHPRAAQNRGRFITSPDRTPWYATPLNHDAIATAGPTIAGELEAGAPAEDEDEDGEAEPVVVGGPRSDATGSTVSDSADEATDDTPIVAPAAPATGVDDTTLDTSETDGSDDASETGGTEADAADESVLSFEESSSDEDHTGTDVEDGNEDDMEEDLNPETDEEDDHGSGDGASGDDRSGDDSPGGDEERTHDSSVENEDDDEDDGEADPETNNGDSLELTSNGTDDSLVESEDAPDDPESEARTDTDSDGGTEFVFDEQLDEEPPDRGTETAEEASEEPEAVTVDEAVDTMNEETPPLSLSSHGFDVSAEADDEGAVLHFEFDPDTVELSGSTRRLLRYQLRSFAGQESTPDAEVSFDGNTIVIELADADGNAVSRWGEGAVGIIDRTLYLSDNSS